MPGIFEENEARRHLAPYDAVLRRIVIDAVSSYRNGIAPLFAKPSRRMRANVIHDFMVQGARKAYGDRVVASGGRDVLYVDPGILVQFKKLDEGNRPRNYPTNQARLFNDQVELPGVILGTRVTVGYRLDRTELEASAVFVTCMSGEEPAWSYEIEAAQPARMFPPDGADARPTRRLKPKKKPGQEKSDSNSGTE